ncbi:MAG: hypothetical protein KF855_03850 [Acidobacteria bacterium]|nr:hypothetical protein [Acidobacteriota bacterium]
MTDETLKITVTFGKPYTFFLRMISIAEENKLRQKSFGLSDDERAEKEYDINVQMLKDLSTDGPYGLFDPRPENLPANDETAYADSFTTPAERITAFFAERTILKERIAFYAVRSYFVRLQPSESFL